MNLPEEIEKKNKMKNEIIGYRIEAKHTIDDGRTWRGGGFHTARQTWFPLTPDGLIRASATADSIVDSMHDVYVMAVVINEQNEAVEYSARYEAAND